MRTAILALLVLSVAGAAPAAQRQYRLQFTMTRHDGTGLASPTLCGIERQVCSIQAGGAAPTARDGVKLDYGIAVSAWMAAAPGGKVLVDVTASSTTIDPHAPAGVAVGGYTLHTVCTVQSGQAINLASFPGSDLACDLTVTQITP